MLQFEIVLQLMQPDLASLKAKFKKLHGNVIFQSSIIKRGLFFSQKVRMDGTTVNRIIYGLKAYLYKTVELIISMLLSKSIKKAVPISLCAN